MTHQEHIRVFDSQGEAYKQAFQIFLEHTDQKRNAKRWLQQVVDDLPMRQVFIDAGAGNGEVTRAFTAAFDRTIAIEPNAYLLNQLQAAVPTAEAIGEPILSARPPAQGDLVLCSHTLYYIPAEEWLTHLERLVSWMSPTGVTIVVLTISYMMELALRLVAVYVPKMIRCARSLARLRPVTWYISAPAGVTLLLIPSMIYPSSPPVQIR